MTRRVNPEDLPLPRMWKRIRLIDSCWVWTGMHNRQGYGRIGINDKIYLAHRVFYEALVGPIPEGLCLDHLCRTPDCVNPTHLEIVTVRENTLRGTVTRCRHNGAYYNPNDGSCRECKRNTQRARRERKRSEAILGISSQGLPSRFAAGTNGGAE